MRFPRTKIWKALNKEDATGSPVRDALRHVRYDAEEKVLVASDSIILAIVEVEGRVPSRSVNIARRAVKDAYRQSPEDGDPWECSLFIDDDGCARVPDGTVHPAADGVGSYPSWQKITERLPDREDCYEISINVGLLANLVAAIGGADIVSLMIDRNDTTSPIKVIPHPPTNAWGVIMPCCPRAQVKVKTDAAYLHEDNKDKEEKS